MPTPTPTPVPTLSPILTPDRDTSLPLYGGREMSGSFNNGPDSVVYRVDDTTAQEFEEYTAQIRAKGYECIMENRINENRYATFRKLDKLVHLVYTDPSSSVMIVHETLGDTPAHFSRPQYQKTVQPLLTQIQLESNDMLEGMSYVFRLSDGTFFIIDGGWNEKNNIEAKKLYNLLKEQSEGGEIIISGWLLTHCHGDHIGAFNEFVELYHDKVQIRQVLYNFPPDEDILASDSPHMLNDEPGRYKNFKRVVSTYLMGKGTDIVKPHTGYKFYYADAEIEILQTHEDFYPVTIRDDGMNLSSVIFTVTIADQRMIFLADSTVLTSNQLVKHFGDYLKSDFMQVAHHGYYGGTVELYRTIDAEYILYPAPVYFYERHINFPENKYFLFDSPTVRQVFTMGFGQFTLPLPYAAPIDAVKIPGSILSLRE
jgi:glyoxylase-like metal-dependent hydrolase (beta-lactamase superfamily II)